MSTGNKLYLADKQTLDSIKSVVNASKTVIDSTKSKVDNLDSNVSDTKTNVENVKSLIASAKNLSTPMTVGTISKLVYSEYNIPVRSNETTILSLTTPGTFYLALILNKKDTNNTSANNTHLRIIADGITIYDSNYTVAANASDTYTGFMTGPAVLGVGENYVSTTAGNISVNSNPLYPLRSSIAGLANVYSIRPIKWNTSLVIQGYATAQAGIVNLYYELD